jgi:hypothetical protein
MILRSKYHSPEGEGGSTGSSAGSNQPSSSGASSDGSADANSSGFVTREAYERLQADLVKYKGRFREADSKNNEYESKEKLRHEEKLLEEKKFQELFENQKKQIDELSNRISGYQNREVQAAKYSALTESLGARIPDKFLPVIPLDEIKVTDGEVDLESVKEVAARFKTEYSEIFAPVKSKDRMGDFPSGSSGKMSVDKFKTLGKQKGAKWMQQQLKNKAVDFG